MGRDVEKRLDGLLDAAEARTSCLVPPTDADKKAAERRRESRLTFAKVPVVRFTFAEATREGYLRRLLTAAGVPLRRPGPVWPQVERRTFDGLPVVAYQRVA